MIKDLVKSSSMYQDYILPFWMFLDWKSRDYGDNAPQVIKEAVLKKYGVSGAQWVETGTYVGTTTAFLARISPKVFTIEPDPKLFEKARDRFRGSGVEVIKGTSEEVLPDLIPTLSGDINFWLDGHYSGGVTFKGSKGCPVEDELNTIVRHISNFNEVAILIDDVRCFLSSSENYADYPSIDYLVDWAREHEFRWRIEQDIFILQKFK